MSCGGPAAGAAGPCGIRARPAFAGVCSYAPTSDLCIAEKAKEAKEAAKKPKTPGAKGPAVAAPKVAAPPPVKLTAEAQAVKDAKDRMDKLSGDKKNAVDAVKSAQAKMRRSSVSVITGSQ